MAEPTVTPTLSPNTANQPSPKAVTEPVPAKPTPKGEKKKAFVCLHMGVGPFVKGDKFDVADLFPDSDDPEPMIQRLIDLEAIATNAE